MPFCNTGEIDIYYEVHGSGFPLLFISGLAGGSWSWYGQVPFFKNHYKCVIFDNRGAGLSSKPTGPYTMTGIAEDALRLLDCLDVDRAHVFSVSMGGMIALEMARIASRRLGALLLGCTHAGGAKRISPSRQTMEILMNNAGLSRQEILWKNTPIFFSERCRMKNWKVIEEYYRAQLNSPKQPEHGLIGQLMAIQQFDCTHALKDIANPALIVTGTKDIVVPAENSHFLSRELPNAQLVELPGVGHAIFAECREILNEMAHRFYQKHRETVEAAEEHDGHETHA